MVLVVLSHHADNDGGNAHPGIALMCSESNLCERAVKYAIKSLLNSAELEIERPSRGQIPASYRINLPIKGRRAFGAPDAPLKLVQSAPDAPVHEMHPKEPLSVHQMHPKQAQGVQMATEGGAPNAPVGVQMATVIGANGDIAYKEEKIEQSIGKSCVKKHVKQPSADVRAVFDSWRERLAHPNAILTPKRQKAIESRLREGYTVEALQSAVDGCRASPWHMGLNDRETVFDDIELICRNGENVEKFISKIEQAKGKRNGTGTHQAATSNGIGKHVDHAKTIGNFGKDAKRIGYGSKGQS